MILIDSENVILSLRGPDIDHDIPKPDAAHVAAPASPAALGQVMVQVSATRSSGTSLSGVKMEMRIAVPAQIAAGALGLVLWLVSRFV